MTRDQQRQLAETFLGMHRGKLLLLPNAWDAMSARIFEASGFGAIATTSGGVAWALGYADGEKAPLDEVIAVIERITRILRIPLTADMEAGYGKTADDVGKTVAEVIRAGAVGLNLEDGLHGPLRPMTEAVDRIRAARAAGQAAGIPIVINARTDLYLQREVPDEAARYAESVTRAKAYLAAGADCVYPIGMRDPTAIAAFVKAVGAPVNVGVRAGMPSVTELEALGVARASTATSISLMAMSLMRDLADDLRATGKFDRLAPTLSHPDAQKLFS